MPFSVIKHDSIWGTRYFSKSEDGTGIFTSRQEIVVVLSVMLYRFFDFLGGKSLLKLSQGREEYKDIMEMG